MKPLIRILAVAVVTYFGVRRTVEQINRILEPEASSGANRLTR